MNQTLQRKFPGTAPAIQIWSAAPTPLTADLGVDVASVEKMVRAAVDDEITGLFLGGTCGEGPWLQDGARKQLVMEAARVARGRLKLAAQVSDNSVPRIMDNVRAMADAGVDYVIIAPPATMDNVTPKRITALFEEAVTRSPLPVGIYDLGRHRALSIPAEQLKRIYLLPNVHFVKDSSGADDRQKIALEARREKPTLRLLNGDEFRCFDYLEAGYDGFMFGGAAAAAPQLRRIADLFQAGRLAEAKAAGMELSKILYGIYGGETASCWLTGLKYYMVRRGLFSSTASYLEYPLTEECRAFVEKYAAGTWPSNLASV